MSHNHGTISTYFDAMTTKAETAALMVTTGADSHDGKVESDRGLNREISSSQNLQLR